MFTWTEIRGVTSWPRLALYEKCLEITWTEITVMIWHFILKTDLTFISFPGVSQLWEP